MNILTTTTPGLNEDRRARWSAIRAAFPNTTSAERLVPTAVRPVTKVNLATSNEQQQSGPRLVLQVALAALGWVGLLALAFAYVVLFDVMVNA